jgi:hypothetical protein
MRSIQIGVSATLNYAPETAHGPESVALCVGNLFAGRWTPTSGWSLPCEVHRALEGSLGYLEVFARQVWAEATEAPK